MSSHDSKLALKVLNNANKAVVAAMVSCKDQETRDHIQRAINNLTFLYDVLHLDEIEVININNNNA